MNAQLERRIGPTNELSLVDPEVFQSELQILNGRFADPDGRNIRRFDQRDVDAVLPLVFVEIPIENQSRQPPGRSAADDGDPFNPVAHSSP
jgi:hypothetical protein